MYLFKSVSNHLLLVRDTRYHNIPIPNITFKIHMIAIKQVDMSKFKINNVENNILLLLA